MGKVNVTKGGNLYQYRFEIAPQRGARKFINKSGFKTKQDAYVTGMKAFNEYMNTGKKFFLNTCHKLVILKNILKLALIPFLYKQKNRHEIMSIYFSLQFLYNTMLGHFFRTVNGQSEIF